MTCHRYCRQMTEFSYDLIAVKMADGVVWTERREAANRADDPMQRLIAIVGQIEQATRHLANEDER